MSSDADPHFAEALARAERRRAKLERLSEIGMELAEQVGAHTAAAMAAINEDHGGDPTRAFATVSRAVRLTLALEARVDAQILALRNGRLPLGWTLDAPSPSSGPRPGPQESRERLRPAHEDLYDRERWGEAAIGAVSGDDSEGEPLTELHMSSPPPAHGHEDRQGNHEGTKTRRESRRRRLNLVRPALE